MCPIDRTKRERERERVGMQHSILLVVVIRSSKPLFNRLASVSLFKKCADPPVRDRTAFGALLKGTHLRISSYKILQSVSAGAMIH